MPQTASKGSEGEWVSVALAFPRPEAITVALWQRRQSSSKRLTPLHNRNRVFTVP